MIDVGTYRFAFTHNSEERGDVWMSELSHDGCFLEEPHSAFCLASSVQCLNGYLDLERSRPPETALNTSELSRSKMTLDSEYIVTKISCHIML